MIRPRHFHHTAICGGGRPVACYASSTLIHNAGPAMKYRKHEAKEAAKQILHGVWTALPTIFTKDDKLDEAGNAANLEHCISKLNLAGHYCIGNVGEFWAMTNEERMRVVEINVETARGRIPLIAGCHHQNPYEAVKLAQHAQSAGVDFVIILTP